VLRAAAHISHFVRLFRRGADANAYSELAGGAQGASVAKYIIEIAILALTAFAGWFGKSTFWIAQASVVMMVHLAMEFRSRQQLHRKTAKVKTVVGVLMQILVRAVVFVAAAFWFGRALAWYLALP